MKIICFYIYNGIGRKNNYFISFWFSNPDFSFSIFYLFILIFFFADHSETKPIVSFIGDICEPETIEKAFQGVDCVFHCAAFINFQFPSDLTELERVNVNGKISDKISYALIKRDLYFFQFS